MDRDHGWRQGLLHVISIELGRISAMLRGLFFGSVWGLLVSGAGAAALSVLSSSVGPAPVVPNDGVTIPQDPVISTSAPLGTPDETLAPSLGDALAIDVQAPDPVSDVLRDTSSVARPETGNVDTAMQAPQASAPSAGVQAGTDDGILPNPQSMAPDAPQTDAMPQVDTTPRTADVETPEQGATPSDGVQINLPQDPPVLDVTAAKPENALETPQPDPAPDVVASESSEQPVDPEKPEPRFALSSEGDGLTNLAPEVKVNRLPSIGDAPAEDAAVEDAPSQGMALQDNAQAFENPENKLLMSIILIDDGSTGIGPEALKSFPYPLTFALDASKADAGTKAAAYRSAGFEVIMLTSLPRGATPADVEVALEAYKLAVPQAVAMLDLGDNGFASSPPLVAQAVQNLKSTGHGLLTLSGGLNSAGRVADRADLPNKPIFRDLDGEGQDATIIRRFLDNAAFKAGQTEGAVLLGRLRPDTISALVLWGGLQRAERVALAPISAVLLSQE